MIELVDTHTHLFTAEFDVDRSAAVQRALDAGVGALCLPAINEESLPSLMAMCDAFPGVCYPMIGLHPTELGDDYNCVLDRMYNILKSDNRIVAIGEVGLDYYWDDTKKEMQRSAFRRQIEWALETALPLAIHSRSAFDDLYTIMNEYRGRGLTGVFHCFSGNDDEARKLLSFDGFYLGIGGVVTYKKSTLPDVLKSVPLERVLLETDSPYLAPVPKRGKRNESSYVPYIADFLAGVYGCPVEEVASVTTANARNLFTKIANR
ncbi:MAG: TatD family hydrolase [Bacteroidaceae bacterium]|jgi:TatD DNase family protein|nr:TatD family hydrolase [Bacteroidaceae bacterium]